MKVDDLLTGIKENGIPSRYPIFVLSAELNSDSEIISQKPAVSVERIEVNHSSRELLLNKKEGGKPVLIEALRVVGNEEVLKYDVCAAEEYADAETTIRIDSPLVGTGENHAEGRFLALCEGRDSMTRVHI